MILHDRLGGPGLTSAIVAAALAAAHPAAAAPRCSGEPGAALEAIVAADNRGDIDEVMRHYSADPIWMRPAGAPLRGRAAIRDSYRNMYRDFAPALTVENRSVERGDDIVLVRGRTGGRLVARDGAGARAVRDDFEAAVICERGSWRVSVLAWRPAS